MLRHNELRFELFSIVLTIRGLLGEANCADSEIYSMVKSIAITRTNTTRIEELPPATTRFTPRLGEFNPLSTLNADKMKKIIFTIIEEKKRTRDVCL